MDRPFVLAYPSCPLAWRVQPEDLLPGDDPYERIAELERQLTATQSEVNEWRQAARVEAGLRREFLDRAETAEHQLKAARIRTSPWWLFPLVLTVFMIGITVIAYAGTF